MLNKSVEKSISFFPLYRLSIQILYFSSKVILRRQFYLTKRPSSSTLIRSFIYCIIVCLIGFKDQDNASKKDLKKEGLTYSPYSLRPNLLVTVDQLSPIQSGVFLVSKISMTSLQQELNHFIYSSVIDPQFINTIKQEFTASKVQHLNDSRQDMNLSVRKQQRINTQRYYQLFKLSRTSSKPEEVFRYADLLVNTYGLILNTSAFLVSIQLLGDQEQVSYWRQQVLQGRAMGAYGQTELGHGSNVKGLQTVAIYDSNTQTFKVTSPKPSSAKFWPGVLGQFCTHSVIQARTIVQGKDIGVQTFVIQLRNARLQPVEKVELFDIGPKLGFDRVDNGGLIFNDLIIPRKALLMRYIKVTPEGKVEGLENTQAIKYGYGSMLNLRVKLTYNFALRSICLPASLLHTLNQAQGISNEPTNRKIVTETLCVGLGICLANQHPHALFNQLLKEISAKNYQKADKLLVSCHIISSTFKALSSRIAVDICAIMQASSPFSKFRTSLIPFCFFNYIPAVTYEGDNTVLLQQTSKYLLFKYNLDKQRPNAPKTFNGDDFAAATLALQQILVIRLKGIKSRMEAHGDKGAKLQSILNELQQTSLIEASILWGYITFLQSMTSTLSKINTHQSFYRKICQCFTSYITSKLTTFRMHGFLVHPIESWKKFSEEEFQAMVGMGGPVDVKLEPMELYPREEQWFQAKL